jgi:hypothetical protein
VHRSTAAASVAALLLAALSLGACSSSSDDPFTADMKMICNAGRGHDDLPPDMRRISAMREIADKIKTPEAARMLAGVAAVAPSEKAAYFRPALDKAGIKRCPFLDEWSMAD